jgi:nucleoside-diphosphate-sugar epimerase
MRAVIPTIIVQALTKGELTLGSLDPVRDLTFVKDTARGFLAAAKSEKVIGEVINLGVGDGPSIGELVERIARLLGKELPVQQDPARVRPKGSEVMRLISDNTKALELMDWRPEVDLDTGLQATIKYVEQHLQEFKADIYAV